MTEYEQGVKVVKRHSPDGEWWQGDYYFPKGMTEEEVDAECIRRELPLESYPTERMGEIQVHVRRKYTTTHVIHVVEKRANC